MAGKIIYSSLTQAEAGAQLLLMRHPETKGNSLRHFVGQTNSPLTDNGELQRQAAVDALIAYYPGLIISSPLDRCMAIARPAAQALGCELKVDERIQEMNFGAIEGMSAQEALDKGLSLPWGEGSGGWPVTGAEDFDEFFSRVHGAYEDYMQLKGKVVLVTHGGVIRAMLSHILGLDFVRAAKLRSPNVNTTILNIYNGEAYIESMFLRPDEVILRAHH
ncbi:MAG: histidine phosphatase family protein [Coriobacteriia bacterium]|nr:histidine phosphatase family protein [Coriobacteriia bacterium]